MCSNKYFDKYEEQVNREIANLKIVNKFDELIKELKEAKNIIYEQRG